MMTGIFLFCGFAALAGIAYAASFYGPSVRFAAASSTPEDKRLADAQRGGRMFNEIGNVLKRHKKVLSCFLAQFTKDGASSTELLSTNSATAASLSDQLEALQQINASYLGVYSNEEENLRSYHSMTLGLERLLETCDSGDVADQQTTVILVKKILRENEKLRTRLLTCERQIISLLSDVSRLEREARTDSLTLLPNRRAWDEDLASRANEFDSVFVMIDLDHFKTINDTHGHSIGDGVLTLVSTLMRDMPEVDCYRIAGDEFAMVLSARLWSRVEYLLEGFRRRVAKATLNHDGRRIQVTISMGASRRLSDESNEQTLRRADNALYKAKSEGGNRVYLHEGTSLRQVQSETNETAAIT